MMVKGKVRKAVNKAGITEAGGTYSEIAQRFSVSEATVQRIKAEANTCPISGGFVVKNITPFQEVMMLWAKPNSVAIYNMCVGSFYNGTNTRGQGKQSGSQAA